MKLYQRIALLMAAVAWFLVLWYLPEYHEYKRHIALMIKGIGAAGAFFLIFTALTGGATDKKY